MQGKSGQNRDSYKKYFTDLCKNQVDHILLIVDQTL